MAPDLNSPNSKSEGMRINSNLNYAETNNTTKSAQKQFTQSGLSNHADINYEKDAVFANRKPQDELVEKRDRTSKHFQNPDGTIEAFLSTGSVNYFEKGAWLTIERAILPNNTKDYPEYEYANTKNSFKTYLSKDQSKGIKTVVEDQEITEWQNKKIEFLDENFNTISLINAENGRLKTDDAKAIYSNIFPYTEAHITQLFDGRKIDYEISSPEFLNHIPANSKYLAVSEDIVLPKGWTAKYYIDKLNENPTETKKQISIFNEKDEEILRYMPPAYFEKNNEHNIENPVGDYEIEQIGQILTIKILVDADWLRNESREFPVVIDPTASVFAQTNARSTGRAYSDGAGGDNQIRIGRWTSSPYAYVMGWARFDLSSISSTNTVSVAEFKMYQNGGSTNRPGSTAQYMLTNCMDPYTANYQNIFNSVNTAYSSLISGLSDGHKTAAFNTTGLSAIQNGLTTGFITIGLSAQGTFWNSYARYANMVGYSGNTTTTGTAYRPYLSVTYTVPSGPPTCATPISPTNGASGTGHSGNLMWEAVAGADTYDVYFGTSATPTQVATDQVATTYPIDCLLPETTYYWKVIPKNGDGSASGCATWSFTTDNKLHIYKNNFENSSEGYFGTSGGTVDGWNTNEVTALGSYNNRWAVGSGTNAISGKSAGLTALLNGALAGSYFEYWWDMGELHRMIYRPFDMTEYRDIELNFDWKCGGEDGLDYGEILSSVNGGTDWLTDVQGGLYSDGKYWNSASTIRSQTLTLPASRNNQSNFVLGFNFDDHSGNGNGTDPSFVVDNIVIKACPYEGYLSSPDQTEPFAWAPPTANTQTTITVNETHDCAYFEWEQSTNNGNTWTVIPGETNVSYTTPSNITSNIFYRCRVYFSTGCPGAYQSEAFKIVFEPGCTTVIAPIDAATNQSTNVTISWDADPLATDYDIYFGEDNPPATLIDNTANTSYDLTNLNYGTTYYWQILPTNAGGTASGCDVWSFTTGAEPPQFHNYGGTEQLTFDNSAYKADAPNFRISHPNTMEEVQIQISQDVSFPGTTVYDGNFTGSFTGESNFETSLEGESVNTSHFPQGFDYDTFTLLAGTPSAGQWSNNWWTLNNRPQMNKYETGGNPAGRVGYETEDISPGAVDWTNQIVLPNIDASGKNEIILTFDVWHSYSADDLTNCIWFETWIGGYKNNIQTVYINDIIVESLANTSGRFYFNEPRSCAKVKVIYNLSEIPENDKSDVGLKIMAKRDSKIAPFYVYFDNVDVTGAAQEFTNGDTYYARARGKIGGNWTDWTSATHSFTYKNQTEIEWHQTAEPQFLTNELNGVITATSPDYATIPASGGTTINPFSNPSFETGTGWSSYKWGPDQLTVDTYNTEWYSDGSRAARMRLFGGWALSSDFAVVSQVVDLTDVEQIIFDAESHYGSNMGSNLANGGTLRLIIGETSNNTTGTVYKTINHCTTGSSGSCKVETLDIVANIDPADRIPDQTVKFVWSGFSEGDVGGAYVYFMVDNIRIGVSQTVGTLTSAPINLPSFYQEDTWYELSWDQTLNGGAISFSIEEDNAGSWDPVVGFTDFSSTTDGNNNLSIESIGSSQQIRLKATFTESGAKGTQPELNNWTIKTKKDEPLPVELLYFTAECNGKDKVLTWETASENNSDYFQIMASTDGKYFVPVAKVQAAGHSSQNIKYNYTLIGQNDKTYYRLKQVDFDGSSETFNIIHIDCGNDVNSQITAYPNPFDGKILYLNSTSTLINSVINIYDALGRLVYQTKCDEINSHVELKIDTKLDPGAYYLEINSENEASKRISLIVK
ncbi:MAG: T9SS type A sorting domain-containing protein [Bacteroidales bacterium]|nr:T9SS type A sorting domain-containing protein [Bacteroidales bacterium]